MSVLMGIWHTMQGIAVSADWITLIIAVVVIVAAGVAFHINSLNALIAATFWSLIAFAVLNFIRAVTLGKQDFMSYLNTDWNNFAKLEMLTLISYAILFGLLIAIVNLIRSAIQR